MSFYPRVLQSLISRGSLSPGDSVLVVCGGENDRRSMMDAKLIHVTISNLAPHNGQSDYAPFQWRRIDAEAIDAPDESYDWVVVHGGLHHLGVPAAGVCEMFRTARRGILCIEARDSVLMRLAVRLGMTSDFELEVALLSGGKWGGYRNGPIPNYVYRWTEREFEKVINTYAPAYRHAFFYEYDLAIPLERYTMARSRALRWAGFLLAGTASLLKVIAPRQGNRFAFGAVKNVERRPWLNADLEFDPSHLDSKYNKELYKS